MDRFRNKQTASSAVLARKFKQNLVSNEFISVKLTLKERGLLKLMIQNISFVMNSFN